VVTPAKYAPMPLCRIWSSSRMSSQGWNGIGRYMRYASLAWMFHKQ
jgi:hypothetical protein